MQSHGITLSFHREMADSSRELVGPDITAAATLERYPRLSKKQVYVLGINAYDHSISSWALTRSVGGIRDRVPWRS
jgi:hypothetical protein